MMRAGGQAASKQAGGRADERAAESQSGERTRRDRLGAALAVHSLIAGRPPLKPSSRRTRVQAAELTSSVRACLEKLAKGLTSGCLPICVFHIRSRLYIRRCRCVLKRGVSRPMLKLCPSGLSKRVGVRERGVVRIREWPAAGLHAGRRNFFADRPTDQLSGIKCESSSEFLAKIAPSLPFSLSDVRPIF